MTPLFFSGRPKSPDSVGFKFLFVAILFVPVIDVRTVYSQSDRVVWSEEFNQKKIDSQTWTYDIGGHGFGNGQLEFNTARPENVYLENGKLVIEARREAFSGRAFTSARLKSQGRFAFQYGSLVARIKIPDTADGLWPAFWMLGDNFPAVAWPGCGEIDILEVGGKEGIRDRLQNQRINSALHFAGRNLQKTSLVEWFNSKEPLHRDFHEYRLTWTPQKMVFQVDQLKIAEWNIEGKSFQEFHRPHFLLLNLAVGSWKSSYTGIDNPKEVTAKFPARMHVDWIRLHAIPETKIVLGKDHVVDGKFGVFSESNAMTTSLTLKDGDHRAAEFQNKGKRILWNNLKPVEKPGKAAEGKSCWSFDIESGDWFGMGVFSPKYRNMRRFSDGYLHFYIKTSSATPIRVGIKSSVGGESWLTLGDQNSEFGFKRDNQWQKVALPLNRFANVDFQTIHQFFMLSGAKTSQQMRLSVDGIWWEPSPERQRLEGNAFGIFTENEDHKSAGAFQPKLHGDFFIWENTFRFGKQRPFEGVRSLSLESGDQKWSGAAFTANRKMDLSHFARPGSHLQFRARTQSRRHFRIGMKSGNLDGVGQRWIRFADGEPSFGLKRDGQWHLVRIPISKFTDAVDFSEVSHLFQILSTEGSLESLELDDICLVAGDAEDSMPASRQVP